MGTDIINKRDEEESRLQPPDDVCPSTRHVLYFGCLVQLCSQAMAYHKMSERVTLELADESNETLSKIDSNALSEVSPGVRFNSDYLRLLRAARCLARSIEKKILLARSFPVRYAVRALTDALGASNA